ncbi:DUF397 domain-containing protein [Streptacidiphilus sp. 4-A2]|nr:DUF397 domain-containing protein [Streptacidiphilus sp. 4-A2]
MDGLAEAKWRKSSFSGANNECVEVAPVDRWIGVRDSKANGQGPVLVFHRSRVGGLPGGCQERRVRQLSRARPLRKPRRGVPGASAGPGLRTCGFW